MTCLVTFETFHHRSPANTVKEDRYSLQCLELCDRCFVSVNRDRKWKFDSVREEITGIAEFTRDRADK